MLSLIVVGLKQDVFLVVIAVVVMVIVYAVIMILVLCLCCYCYKNSDNKEGDKIVSPYQKQESVYSPEPFKAPERANSVISQETIGKEAIPRLNYYDVPHPFSRVSSDGRSHDTMELIGVPPSQVCYLLCVAVYPCMYFCM